MDSAVERSLRAFPAGCNGEFNLPPSLAKVIMRGQGCELWTSAGERMLDFSMGWGSALPGHAHPELTEAVARQLSLGANFAYVTAASLRLADEIIAASPCCEQIRYCASGTEATMYCLRLARAFTGRRKILKFEGAYHGSHDVGVASLFPSAPADFPFCTPSSAGVDSGSLDNTLIAPFNDLETTTEIIDRYRHELAAIIVEPFQRCLSPAPGFLEGLREIASKTGVLLIFDEVVTGFRLAYGGAQEYYGVSPDLIAYGKALGGGFPIGVYGGRRDVIQYASEDRFGTERYVWTASTLGGNPISATAALASLEIYRKEEVYPRLYRLGEYLRSGLRETLSRAGVQAHVLGDGPIAQFALTPDRPHDYRSSRHNDGELARAIMLEMFARGVFLNPMGTKLYLSLAHNESVCDEFIEIFAAAIAAVQVGAN